MRYLSLLAAAVSALAIGCPRDKTPQESALDELVSRETINKVETQPDQEPLESAKDDSYKQDLEEKTQEKNPDQNQDLEETTKDKKPAPPDYKRLDIRLDDEKYVLVPESNETDHSHKGKYFKSIYLAGNKACLNNTEKALSLILETDQDLYELTKKSLNSITDDGRFGIVDFRRGMLLNGSLLVCEKQYLGSTKDYARLIVSAAARLDLHRQGYKDKDLIEKKVQEAEQSFLEKLK